MRILGQDILISCTPGLWQQCLDVGTDVRITFIQFLWRKVIAVTDQETF
jgi:hypothetical protein